MKTQKLLTVLIPCLSITLLASCGNKNNSTILDESVSNIVNSVEENLSSEVQRESVEQVDDVIKLIPEEVLNAQNVEIDILEYIEGQNGTIKDLGSIIFEPKDLFSADLARYYAAAREFKKIAPGVSINLIYCSIGEYTDYRIAYNQQRGHLPHIMHPTQSFYKELEGGFIADLSQYQDSEYYQAFDDYFLSQVSYGGFVTCFPHQFSPYGMFVNKDILRESYVVDTNDADAYEEWVDNLTYESWVNSLEKTYSSGNHAGIGKLDPEMLSFINPDIYQNYAANGTINLSSNDMEKWLALENKAAQYAAYQYPEAAYASCNTGKAEDGFNTFHTWSNTQNFAQGGFTYDVVEPWNLGAMSQYIIENNKDYSSFDYIPYPKLDGNTENKVGLKIGGLEIGNQCPIGSNCSEQRQLEQDIAAYFTMFMINDPRAIKAKAEVKWRNEEISEQPRVGVVSLPMMEPDFKFSWQSDEEVLKEIEDPAADYTDNWEYQMTLYLKTYSAWWNSSTNSEPDVIGWSNVNYGFGKLMDIVYKDQDNVVNPTIVPQQIASGDGTEEILRPWKERYYPVDNSEGLSTSTYVSGLLATLASVETKVNNYAAEAYAYLQECVDQYYGEGKYNILG